MSDTLFWILWATGMLVDVAIVIVLMTVLWIYREHRKGRNPFQ